MNVKGAVALTILVSCKYMEHTRYGISIILTVLKIIYKN